MGRWCLPVPWHRQAPTIQPPLLRLLYWRRADLAPRAPWTFPEFHTGTSVRAPCFPRAAARRSARDIGTSSAGWSGVSGLGGFAGIRASRRASGSHDTDGWIAAAPPAPAGGTRKINASHTDGARWQRARRMCTARKKRSADHIRHGNPGARRTQPIWPASARRREVLGPDRGAAVV